MVDTNVFTAVNDIYLHTYLLIRLIDNNRLFVSINRFLAALVSEPKLLLPSMVMKVNLCKQSQINGANVKFLSVMGVCKLCVLRRSWCVCS